MWSGVKGNGVKEEEREEERTEKGILLHSLDKLRNSILVVPSMASHMYGVNIQFEMKIFTNITMISKRHCAIFCCYEIERKNPLVTIDLEFHSIRLIKHEIILNVVF